MVNAASRRVGANMMIASGNDTLTDGTKLTMALYDSWDEEAQRAFVCNFLCERWDNLSDEKKAEEQSKMPQICHLCGAAARSDLSLAPDASVGYTKLFCQNCALKVLMAGGEEEGTTNMLVTVRPHPEWGWDPGPRAPVRVHGLASRADLNGQTGVLLSHDAPSGRWCLRLDGSGESVRIKQSNFTYHGDFTFRLPEDGSTRVHELRADVKAKIAPNTYTPSQFSLWLSQPALTRMDVDCFDADGVCRPMRLRDYGVGVVPVESRTLYVLISPSVKTANGLPEELDPASDYCRKRVWPPWMTHAAKVAAHELLFGDDARMAGPPYHPDVTPIGSFDAAGLAGLS